MQDKLMKFDKMLERELETELDKVEQNGSISPDSIKTLKDAFKLKKLVKECCEDDGYSSRRDRSRTTGRYVSRDSYGSYDGASNNSFGSYDGSYDGMSNRGSYRGYSGHDKMIQHLERMYDEAEDEKERQMIDQWIRKAEQTR